MADAHLVAGIDGISGAVPSQGRSRGVAVEIEHAALQQPTAEVRAIGAIRLSSRAPDQHVPRTRLLPAPVRPAADVVTQPVPTGWSRSRSSSEELGTECVHVVPSSTETVLTFLVVVVLAQLVLSARGNLGVVEMVLVVGLAAVAAVVAWFVTGPRETRVPPGQDDPRR